MAERVAAEMFGQFFSLHLQALEAAAQARRGRRRRGRSLDRFLRLASAAGTIDELLRDNLPDFSGAACPATASASG